MNMRNKIVIVLVIGIVLLSGCVGTQPKTVYSGTLTDSGLSNVVFTIEDATSYTSSYTGKDLWGNPEYNVRVCWDYGCQSYGNINIINLYRHTLN